MKIKIPEFSNENLYDQLFKNPGCQALDPSCKSSSKYCAFPATGTSQVDRCGCKYGETGWSSYRNGCYPGKVKFYQCLKGISYQFHIDFISILPFFLTNISLSIFPYQYFLINANEQLCSIPLGCILFPLHLRKHN